jgi:anti-anti-sigma regulatory factor
LFRITEISQDDKTVTLRLEGRVVGSSASELETLCLHHRNDKNRTVVLDFARVSFIDDNTVRILKGIKDEGVKMINCSPFIGSLLRDLITDRCR